MPYTSRVDVVRLLAERYDTKSNVKLGAFRSQLQVSYVSSHTEELWYNETTCLWKRIYIYIYILIDTFFLKVKSIQKIHYTTDPYAFIAPAKMFFTPRDLYGPLSEALC